MGKIKIVALSDLHGILPIIDKKVDLCLIAGDISPLDIEYNIVKMSNWLFSTFSEWTKTIPAEKIILIAGNHDYWFETASESQIFLLEKEAKLKYLDNEMYFYYDDDNVEWHMFGTPYCHIFGNWPFMKNDNILFDKFSKIPDKVDIIISHDPPYNIGEVDMIHQNINKNYKYDDTHLGNKILRNKLDNVEFKLLVSGHIHTGSHDITYFNDGICSNVSILNEKYKETFLPFYIELEKEMD